MKIREAGVIGREDMYFRSSDLFAKNNLLYILWGSVYLLDAPYEVKRNYMDAYMVQYIISGELHFEIRGEHIVATKDELVLLDCKEVNHYWAEAPAKVKWFHFNGNLAKSLVDYIYQNNGNGYFGKFYAKNVENYIDTILNLLRNKNSSDFQISHNIYSILCELAVPPPLQISPAEDTINKAVQYMRDNYNLAITIKEVADFAGVSVFYFTRLFKRLMRVSPHAYLTNLRLDNAKSLLTYTCYSIEEVAEKSGFQSSTHFIRAFKQSTSITPKNFRKYSTGINK